MADYSEKCAYDCSFDYNEDKQKGVCLIKEEFIIRDHERLLSKDCLTAISKQKITANNIINEDGSVSEEPVSKQSKVEDKKQKLRGQNKARPLPFKALNEQNLCPCIADQVLGEVERKCEKKKCTFLHDRIEYLRIKPDDIGQECHLFNLTGKCPRGLSCRMGSKHLTKDGFNIVDKEKFEKFQKLDPSTKNYLSKELQRVLKKYKYNFSKAQNIVKANNAPKKKILVENVKSESTVAEVLDVVETEIKNGSTVDNSVNEDEEAEKKIGPVEDYDVIEIRDSEKKKIDWSNKILLSPLTTLGNLPFRRICKEFGADITCGEMALATKILKGAPEEWALVKRHETENIFGVQLCGSNPGVLTRCADLLNREIDVDYIDINLGCPLDLIYRWGAGSAMLNRLNVLESVVKSVSQVLDIPLSVKARTGVYFNKPVAHNLMPKFRDWGVSMITIHGRSREQRYAKLADWEYIEKCAQAAKPIPIYGNGDIFSYDDYRRVQETYTTVQGVAVGRGALIKPWIFTELKEGKLIDITSGERFEILKKYANYGFEHWGSDTRGVETTRKFMLEWMSFLHRYVPVGILEKPPQKINKRPPFYRGRDDLETLMASSNCADWIKISEMLLGKVPTGFHFLPKHKANL